MHTHHTHSGQYVQHAKDTLDQVVAAAIEKQFEVFCLTEHMPRYSPDELYPEEIASNTTPAELILTFEKYYMHAQKIKKEINEKRKLAISQPTDHKRIPQILVGFECESLSDSYFEHVENLQKLHSFDLVVGSVHHVHSIPIDFDQEKWNMAAEYSISKKSKNNEGIDVKEGHRALFNDYFDLQYRLLQRITPTVIGHFDLIRLFSPKEYLTSGFIEKEWPEVWAKIVRNVEYSIGYGALFELNSSAVRKGWDTPYPGPDIAKIILEKGGMFCLSDDSHGVNQVGLNYNVSLKYLQSLGAEKLYYLSLPDNEDENNEISKFVNRPIIKSILLNQVKEDVFWKQY